MYVSEPPACLCQVLELTQGQRVEVEILAVLVQQIQDSRCQHGMDGTHTPGNYSHAFATYMVLYMVFLLMPLLFIWYHTVCGIYAHASAIYMVVYGMVFVLMPLLNAHGTNMYVDI